MGLGIWQDPFGIVGAADGQASIGPFRVAPTTRLYIYTYTSIVRVAQEVLHWVMSFEAIVRLGCGRPDMHPCVVVRRNGCNASQIRRAIRPPHHHHQLDDETRCTRRGLNENFGCSERPEGREDNPFSLNTLTLFQVSGELILLHIIYFCTHTYLYTQKQTQTS